NARGFMGTTLLLYALRELPEAPQKPAALGALLRAGADPNLGTEELPLQLAIRESRRAGPEAVALLLGAGPNPNPKDHFGGPVWFGATGITIDPAVLDLVLDRGAELNVKDGQGQSAIIWAAMSAHWKAVLLLLRRGAEWKQARHAASGQTLLEYVKSQQRVF